MGPFERRAKILESDLSVGKGAGHHSVQQVPGRDEYLICYHRRPLEEEHHNHRVTCIDRLEFDEKGDILPRQTHFLRVFPPTEPNLRRFESVENRSSGPVDLPSPGGRTS